MLVTTAVILICASTDWSWTITTTPSSENRRSMQAISSSCFLGVKYEIQLAREDEEGMDTGMVMKRGMMCWECGMRRVMVMYWNGSGI